MGQPSVFDLELADLAEDAILRQRRAQGGHSPLTDSEYAALMELEVGRARKEFGPPTSLSKSTAWSAA